MRTAAMRARRVIDYFVEHALPLDPGTVDVVRERRK
jgi:hypothetical protein